MKRNLMLGMAVLAGALSLGANRASAATVGVYVGVQPAYAYAQPPCPGEGYVWAAGYWRGGYWVPGRWNFVGVRHVYYGRYDRDRYVDRDRGWHGNYDRGHRWDHR